MESLLSSFRILVVTSSEIILEIDFQLSVLSSTLTKEYARYYVRRFANLFFKKKFFLLLRRIANLLKKIGKSA